MEPQPKLLIVDDEPIIHEVLEGHLISEPYTFRSAFKASEAIVAIEEEAPDLILLDIMMPDVSGLEVCKELKANKLWRHIPIILITSMGDKGDMIRGLEAGADDFLHKPVDSLELKARVRAQLRVKQQYDELQELLQLREDLSRALVHDMRTPLSSIIGFSEMFTLVGPDLSKQQQSFIDRIKSQANRLNSFMNDLLMLAKMESGQLLLNRVPTNVNALVTRVVESHLIVAQSRQIAFKIDLPDEIVQLTCDELLMERVLDNLISNALKYAPQKSDVIIQLTGGGATPDGPQMSLQVIDRGRGIAMTDRERIFDTFETTGVEMQGILQIGIGLAFCKLVVEAHQGRIFVKDNQPTGAIFRVEI